MRYRALDSLRGVCASMVVLMHFQTTGWISRNPTVQHGYLFVDFFFVLSGFVIAASYGDKLTKGFSLLKFMGLRFGRLYPLHVAMLAAFLAAHVGIMMMAPGLAHGQGSADSYSTSSFFASLTLTQIFIGRDTTFWNAPSWSIAAEFWTYLIFALLFRSAGRAIVPVCLCVAVLSGWCLFEFSPDTYHFMNDFHDGALLRSVYGFGLGVVMFQLHRLTVVTRGNRIALWTAIEAIVVLIAAVAVGLAGETPLELLIPFVFCGVVLVFSHEAGALSSLLQTRAFTAVGTYSYSIYLVHFFLLYKVIGVLKLAERAGPALLTVRDGKEVVGISELSGDLASVAFLLFVIGCAAISYRWIERPAREWSRRLILGDRPARSIRTAEENAPAF